MIVKGDYATELGTDGSLVFNCVEPKHSGRYVALIESMITLGTCSSHESLHNYCGLNYNSMHI